MTKTPDCTDAPCETPDLSVWGKWGNGGELRYPLLAHLLDSAAAARVLWERWLRPELREALAVEFCLADSGSAHLAQLAGLHDLGKLSPLFQGQLLSPAAGQFSDHIASLGTCGYWIPSEGEIAPLRISSDRGRLLRQALRHEVESYRSLAGDPGDIDESKWVAAVLAGHHGRYPSDLPPLMARGVNQHEHRVAQSRWRSQQNSHRDAVIAALRSGELPPASPSEGAEPLVLLWTGLVSLSDWIASDESAIRASLDADLPLLESGDNEGFLEARARYFNEAVISSLGLPSNPPGTRRRIFGFEPDRQVQQWSAADAGDGLAILSVPMGEGKTEAALLRHLDTDSAESLFFALPTMATADAMLERVRSFYRDTDQYATLAHGRAMLNEFYSASPAQLITSDEMGGTGGGLSPNSWFSGRHRSLLAPVSVGTCDQALAGVLRHKYNFMRLTGLANSHIVLDEVHTYDPYMDHLLEQLLEWCGATRTRVTLLSATLPRRRAQAYMAAYERGRSLWSETAVPELPEDLEYPYVLAYDGNGLRTESVPVSRNFILEVETHPTSLKGHAQDTAALAAELAAPGAKVGVVVNTVDRAMQVASALEGRTSVPVVVLHARMTSNQRTERTAEVLALCGKGSPGDPVIVVATQIIEASMDLDFDCMVSDLAPAASLLQRSGRMWRHSTPTDGGWAHSRPRPTERPVLHLMVACNNDGTLAPRMNLPYSSLEVRKTWELGLQSGARTQIAVPGDLQELVDITDVTWADLGAHDESWDEAVAADLAGTAIRRQAAQNRVIQFAQLADRFDAPTLAAATAGNLGLEEKATRWVEQESIVLVILGEGPLEWSGPPEELLTRRDRKWVLDVLGHTVAVSGALAHKIADLESTIDLSDARAAVLRDVIAVPSEAVALLAHLDTVLGLVRTRRDGGK